MSPVPDPAFPSAEADDRATVAAGFVAGLLSGLGERDARALLAGVGLAMGHRDGPLRTPLAAYAALYNAVVQALQDEAFGLFRSRLAPGTFEFLCRSTVGAPTLGVAFERAARFLAIVLPDLAVTVSVEGDRARIEIAEPGRPLRARASDPRRVFAFEWLLRLLHGLACWLAGRALTLESVAFPYPPPPHAPEYARVYTEHSTFGAPGLVAALDARVLGLPVRRSQGELDAFLEGAPGKIAMLYRRDREVALAVRQLLAGSLDQSPDFGAIARSLNLSGRSLHRRLAEEGTSLRAIKETLRRERAIHVLETSDKSVADLAAELGYSEPSAFFRAFVGWTGMAPSVYRKRNVFTKLRQRPTP
jgi:AraC-like DNA-binding protein